MGACTDSEYHDIRGKNMPLRALILALLAVTQFHSIEAAPAYHSNEMARQGSTVAPKPSTACAIEFLTDAEGVDFDDYLRAMRLAVKRSWLANMPPSFEKGERGKNTVEFRILRNGRVPKDSVKLMVSSMKRDFDAASLAALREAGPFSHLPQKFSKPYLELRFTFFYNVSLPVGL